MIESNEVMSVEEIYSLRYNILKYYGILLKEFINSLKPEKLEQKRKLKWAEFMKTNEFKDLLKEFRNKEENA